MLTTTFQNIRKYSPCEDGYRKLAKALGGIKSYGEATPIPILKIIETNGIDDALWCLRAVRDKAAVRLVEVEFLIWLLADPDEGVIRFAQGEDRARQRKAIECVVGWLVWERRGKLVARDEWDAARDAARDANVAVAWTAARGTAWAVTRGAARHAARHAAWDAAGHAAGDAAWDAAWHAAWDAARDAARDAQARKLTEILSAREQGEG